LSRELPLFSGSILDRRGTVNRNAIERGQYRIRKIHFGVIKEIIFFIINRIRRMEWAK